MPAPAAVLVDLDNTLVDRDVHFAEFARRFVAERQLGDDALAVVFAADRDGHASREEFFDTLTSQLPLREPADQLVAWYKEHFSTTFRAMDGAIDALRRLRAAGTKIAVVTNGEGSQRKKIAAAQLEGEVDAICVSGEIDAWKPDPRIFHHALQLLDAPGPTWMVGDNATADIGGAREVGLLTAWVSRGRQWPESSWTPDLTVDSVPAFADAVLLS